ncbi:acetyltransferase (GNAT) domain protein [Leptospira fainei serovar Hurstbridge str. BUT 6]|uniref:Acetyltransferase (GNAT) domain protein n=1 Tax=Leptospira fainei serovar Hurstbridge str. BUT 6 TaxID=1193011 RepID=S3VHY4_9LEPT|nr:GNAT family N-acetyltransferase [Leptospira fainei]EPG76050.1 acetyltransferase (GNAT) domain protein [Leptospira fainei serovar Hurstbridge str. BUT 6]
MEEFVLIKAKIDFIKEVYDLSNSREVRENSLNPSEIPWDVHVEWYNSKIKAAPENLFLIITDVNGEFLGQVRFQAANSEEAVISISLSKTARGRSLASKILEAACKLYAAENLEKRTILAQISKDNIPSIKSFSRAAFIYDSDFELDKKQYILMKKVI